MARPSGARRRRSRRTCTSRTLRPGALPGHTDRRSVSRPTTAPKRTTSASASRASTGGSDTQPEPKRRTPWASISGTARRWARLRIFSPSMRARTSDSGAGRRIQSSRQSTASGGGIPSSISRSRGMCRSASFERCSDSLGQRTNITSTTANGKSGSLPICFEAVKPVARSAAFPGSGSAELAAGVLLQIGRDGPLSFAEEGLFNLEFPAVGAFEDPVAELDGQLGNDRFTVAVDEAAGDQHGVPVAGQAPAALPDGGLDRRGAPASEPQPGEGGVGAVVRPVHPEAEVDEDGQGGEGGAGPGRLAGGGDVAVEGLERPA